MDFKINQHINRYTGFNGPSQSYFDARERFDDILRSKLNIQPPDLNEAVGSDKSLDNRNINSSEAARVQSLMNLAKASYSSGDLASSVIHSGNVTRKSTLTTEQINDKLKGTRLEGLGSAFKDAENKYGVNSMFLLGLAIHESDFGNSKIAREKNNLFGFKAYDSSPYESAQSFSSLAGGVDQVAKYLSENYLDKSGKYFNGFSIRDIGKRYATDPNWATGIERRIRSLLGL